MASVDATVELILRGKPPATSAGNGLGANSNALASEQFVFTSPSHLTCTRIFYAYQNNGADRSDSTEHETTIED